MAQAMSIDKLRDQINAYPAGVKISGTPRARSPRHTPSPIASVGPCEENKLASPYGTVFDPFHFSEHPGLLRLEQ